MNDIFSIDFVAVFNENNWHEIYINIDINTSHSECPGLRET